MFFCWLICFICVFFINSVYTDSCSLNDTDLNVCETRMKHDITNKNAIDIPVNPRGMKIV